MSLRKSVYLLSTIVLFTFTLSPLQSISREKLVKTPRDHEGPFYPIVRQLDEDNDLIHVAGRSQTAQGDVLHLSGRVIDKEGRPFDNAVVEIWQTDPYGRYKDQRDNSPGPRDPDFQYWGKAVTMEDGAFSFTTLVPGAYEPRPAHIHFKVWIDDKVRLTSQIYLRETNMRVEDRFTQHVASDPQTVDLQKTKGGEYKIFFQIVL